jgi:serine/threonine-protein kinase
MADETFKPSRRAGERLGNYRILGLLGRGGLSEVYVAENVVTKTRVAIKVLARRHQNRPDLRKRLEQESVIYDALDHPNIVRMRDAGMLDDGTIYIVMDLIRGRTLTQQIQLATPDLGGAMHIMIEATAAMCFAHRRGVLHRDLKPDNIMVTPDGDVKVLDFGIAKFNQGGQDSKEMPKMGTLAFLAPEQLGNKRPADERSDIYALGMVFYLVLSGGVHPFENDDEETSEAEMMARQLAAEPRPLPEFVEHCSDAAWAIVSKCLAKNPDDRYASMDEFLEDLSSVIHDSVPPDDPIAQRAIEEQQVARATAELVNFTAPTWATPFERAAPRVLVGAGHTAKIPAAPASAVPQGALPDPSQLEPGRTAVPPAPPAPERPPPARESPVAAFAPARAEFTPSSSDAGAPPRRDAGAPAHPGAEQQRSKPPTPEPMNAQHRSLSNTSVVMLALATGLVASTMLLATPWFRHAFRPTSGRQIEVPVASGTASAAEPASSVEVPPRDVPNDAATAPTPAPASATAEVAATAATVAATPTEPTATAAPAASASPVAAVPEPAAAPPSATTLKPASAPPPAPAPAKPVSNAPRAAAPGSPKPAPKPPKAPATPDPPAQRAHNRQFD